MTGDWTVGADGSVCNRLHSAQ